MTILEKRKKKRLKIVVDKLNELYQRKGFLESTVEFASLEFSSDAKEEKNDIAKLVERINEYKKEFEELIKWLRKD